MNFSQPSESGKKLIGALLAAAPRRWAGMLAVGASLLASSAVTSARSEEYALLVGGGNRPTRNPVSLEAQVLQAESVLRARGLARIDVLFADGHDEKPDLIEVIADDTEEDALVRRQLHWLYPEFPAERVRFRNHRVKNARGAATIENLSEWFDNQGALLKAGDRLLLYFATHGTESKAPEVIFSASELLLWNDAHLTAKQLKDWINRLPPGVSVTLVMTACHGGGFACLSRNDPDANGGISRSVTGFFACEADRPAAGCTSQADARSYGPCFWSGLAGHWPDGTRLANPADRNEDGRVSYAEAHAFALLHDNTLDTPLKTSVEKLRWASRYGRPEETDLVMNNAGHEEILQIAPALDAFVLEELSAELKLTGRRRMAAARREAEKLLYRDIPLLADRREQLVAQCELARKKVHALLAQKYPARHSDKLAEVSDKPSVKSLLPAGFLDFVTGLAEFQELAEIETILGVVEADWLEAETRLAHYRRYIVAAETVIFAHNLRKLPDNRPALREYEALIDAENPP